MYSLSVYVYYARALPIESAQYGFSAYNINLMLYSLHAASQLVGVVWLVYN